MNELIFMSKEDILCYRQSGKSSKFLYDDRNTFFICFYLVLRMDFFSIQNELSTFFGSHDLTNHDKLQSILAGWVESLQGRGEDNVPSQAAPIRYNFTPIWTLFSDASVSNYAKEYFLKKYKDMGIDTYLGMMNGNQFKGEDLLNR